MLSQSDNSQILTHLTKTLPQKRGIDKNLFVKNFIKDIIYSPSQIQINLYYYMPADRQENIFEENNDSFSGGENQKDREKIRDEFSRQNIEPQVRNSLIGVASNLTSNRQVAIIIPNTIHKSKKRIL